MPENISPYIDRFSAFMAAPSQQVCISSFGDRMVFGEVSPYTTHDVMRNFFRRLVALGVDVELASNDYDASADGRADKHPQKSRQMKEETKTEEKSGNLNPDEKKRNRRNKRKRK